MNSPNPEVVERKLGNTIWRERTIEPEVRDPLKDLKTSLQMVLADPKREQYPAGKKIQEVNKTSSGEESNGTNMAEKIKAISQPETRADESALMAANNKAVANFKTVKYKKGIGKLKEASTPGSVTSPRNHKKVKNPGPKPQPITKQLKVVHKNYKSEEIKGETGRKVEGRVQDIEIDQMKKIS